MSTADREERDRLEGGRDDPAAQTSRRVPHVTENDEQGDLQDGTESPTAIPGLPANASGTDKMPVSAQDEPIDDESMYDGRTERDANQPPSDRVKQ